MFLFEFFFATIVFTVWNKDTIHPGFVEIMCSCITAVSVRKSIKMANKFVKSVFYLKK